MVELRQYHQCSKEGCNALETGICMEGNDPTESCPFLTDNAEQIVADLKEDLQDDAFVTQSQDIEVDGL